MDLFIENNNRREKIEKAQFSVPSSSSSEAMVFKGKSPKKSEPNVQEDRDERYYEERAKEFFYLHDCDLLETNFSLCGADITQNYNIHLIGYNLVLENSFPYVLYLMSLEKGSWRFPSIPFVCAANFQEDGEDEKTSLDVYFENKITMHILTYLNVDGDLDLENIYKGFVKSDQDENTIYAFLDISGLELKKKDTKTLLISVDEIVNKHQCLGFEIAKECYQVFYQDPCLYTIKDESNKFQDIPYSMFLCKRENNNFANMYNEYEMDLHNDYEYMTLLDHRTEHPILGNFYFFSLLPLEYRSSITKIKRFLGITKTPYYIFQAFDNVFKEDLPRNMTLSDVIPTIVDYFNKKEPQDSNDEQEDTNDEQEDSNDEQRDNNDEPLDTNDESMEKTFYTEFKQNIVDHASIYFRELNNDVNTPFWCIKDSNDFVEL